MRRHRPSHRASLVLCVVLLCGSFASAALAQDPAEPKQEASPQEPAEVLARPGMFASLTEPPCSYCITQDLKGLVRPDDRVVAWLRGKHQGGAMPIRHFLSAPRVLNDTYGLFFYDPDGGYVSAFEKDYGYEFYGWRRGVMVVRDREGNLFSALTGVAFEGPAKGKALRRIPSVTTTWSTWLLLHPESTAYDLFDGQRYPIAELPTAPSEESLATMGEVDPRFAPRTPVLGIHAGGGTLAVPLENLGEREVFQVQVGKVSVAVFWYGPTRSAVAWNRQLGTNLLDFAVDPIAPLTAPFQDRASRTRWSLAGRGIDGGHRGKELEWVESVQCTWYAWVAEHPDTRILLPPAPTGEAKKDAGADEAPAARSR